jgi:hypothetical protein
MNEYGRRHCLSIQNQRLWFKLPALAAILIAPATITARVNSGVITVRLMVL